MEEAVWSVIYFIMAGLTGTGYFIYYIMRMAYREMRDDGAEPGNQDSSLGSES